MLTRDKAALVRRGKTAVIHVMQQCNLSRRFIAVALNVSYPEVLILHITLRIPFTLEHFILHHHIHTVSVIKCVLANFAKVQNVTPIYAGRNMFVEKK